MANCLSQQTLRNRFAQLPQDRHVTIRANTTEYGTYYIAQWVINKKHYKLYLGKDTDGLITAYIQQNQQKTYNKHPLVDQVLVRDELDKPVYLDEDLSLFFVGGDSYVKTIFVRDGKRMVFDACAGDSGQYVPLEKWLWEAHHEDEVRGGKYEVVQIKQGNDYRIANLTKQLKKKENQAA